MQLLQSAVPLVRQMHTQRTARSRSFLPPRAAEDPAPGVSRLAAWIRWLTCIVRRSRTCSQWDLWPRTKSCCRLSKLQVSELQPVKA